MKGSILLRGVSAGALMLAISASAAQEALPTIDIGAGDASGASPGQDVAPTAKGSPKDPAAYKVWNTSSATKTNTPVMQTPVSVQVVPKQVLQDQQTVVIDEAVRNVSDAYSVPYNGLQGGWVIRGFLDYAYYQDGVRVNPWAALPPRDTVDVQQVEIVKGPSSILYGRMQPGGLVEVTTKKPEAEPHYEVQQIFGSYSSSRTAVNMTGPVTKDKSLLYRFDASYQNENSFRDGLHDRHVYLAPKLYFEPAPDTSATIYMNFYSGRDPIDAGLPAIYSPLAPKSWNSAAAVPISRNYGSVDAALETKTDFRFGYHFAHSFDSNWKIVHRFDINVRDFQEPWTDVYNPDPGSCTLFSCPVSRDAIRFAPVKEQTYFSSLDLTGRFNTFGLEHSLLVGVDGYHANDYSPYSINYSLVPATDLFNPAYPGNLMQYTSAPDAISRYTESQSWYGVYVQDQIKLPYNFHLLAGFRYDSARVISGFSQFYPSYKDNPSPTSADAIKPRVGLLWQPVPQLSLYGNYVEGFGVSNGIGSSGKALPPEEARQWEGGVKLSLFDDRLTTTASWFHIVKTHVPSPLPPGGGSVGLSEATGAVRNTGVEFDVQGQVTPELKLIGSFATIDTKIVSDIRGGKIGNHWWGVPRNAGSFWAVYEPQFEPFRGFALGAGLVSRGSVEVDRNNSFTLPGYTIFNLMARYSFEYQKTKLTFQVNADNITDKTYYVSQGWTGNFIPGAPRIFRGSLKVEF